MQSFERYQVKAQGLLFIAIISIVFAIVMVLGLEYVTGFPGVAGSLLSGALAVGFLDLIRRNKE